MKKIMFSLIMLSLAFTLGQNKMYIWKNGVITDSMDITNDLKISFKRIAFICGASTIEYSGMTYHTVQIGTQCWLKENLDIGTMIQGNANPFNNTTIEKYCYDNNEGYCSTYGGLYNWNEAMQYVTTEGAQGICPTGWHIPTYVEQLALYNAVGYNSNALKAIWQGIGIGAGTNTSGFSALLAGYRYYDGTFTNLTTDAHFWSSTEFAASHAYSMYLSSSDSSTYFDDSNKSFGYSVRCVKD